MTLPESAYRDLFARQHNGKTEVAVPFGRIDVVTKECAVEVEPYQTWRHGVRQAMAYGAQVRQTAALALYGKPDGDYHQVKTRSDRFVRLYVLDGTRWVLAPRSGMVRRPASDDAIRAALGAPREKRPPRVGLSWRARLTEEQVWARQCRQSAGLDHVIICEYRDESFELCPIWESHWNPGWGVVPYHVAYLDGVEVPAA